MPEIGKLNSLQRLLYFRAEAFHERDFSTSNLGLWYGKAAATGLPFARGRLDATEILLVHAPPPVLTVEVRSENGRRLAYAKDLEQTADRPMARLTIHGESITRNDLWPVETDIGRVVILPGGEVGKLVSWWNAEDGSEWRWQVEFYNHR